MKKEPTVYKVVAMCAECDRDYGVLDAVPRTEIDHLDEMWTEAEHVVRQYMQ